jgi:hypothetical protein
MFTAEVSSKNKYFRLNGPKTAPHYDNFSDLLLYLPRSRLLNLVEPFVILLRQHIFSQDIHRQW